MDSLANKKNIIKKKKEEIAKRYGTNPLIESSGIGINCEEDCPERMKINLDLKIIKKFFSDK